MSYTLVIAEKPSVARDIARVLGVRGKGDGYLDGGDVRVTWAVGHLVALSEPEEIDKRYSKWRAEDLPILPEQIPLKVLPKTRAQYRVIRDLVRDKACTALICATDAGREGELIFRYVYRMIGSEKPFERLWISSMTDEAIREGFAALKPGQAYDALYESARCRSEADWLVGMNASRAFTLRYDVLLSVGRVQTPTLALLVRRHHEIAAFTPTPYWTVTAHFGDYSGKWINEATKEKRVHSQQEADAIVQKVRGGQAAVEQVAREAKRERPPQLYDLTSLQRDANRRLGFTAQKTLATAQKLYEESKLLTYPRTDSRYLPRDMAARTRAAIAALPEEYAAHAAPLLAQERLPMPGYIFNDAKVTDHHAILPTGKRADLSRLPADSRALFDLVVRRTLAAFYPEHLYDRVRVLTRAQGEPFESIGREVTQAGWKAVYADAQTGKKRTKKTDEEADTPLPTLKEGEERSVTKVSSRAEETKPPPPHTDATLLDAMEHAGRTLEDESLRESMRQSGLGTPATRAAIIERLLQVGYAQRRGKAIAATDKGVKLIAVAPEAIISPEMTGRWEKALGDIAGGTMEPGRFLQGIRRMTQSLVESARGATAEVVFEKEEKPRRGGGRKKKTSPAVGVPCPLCGKGEVLENSKAFYCARWKEGCGLTIWKDTVVRAGGPELTVKLVSQLLPKGTLRGSTGVLTHEKGEVRFRRNPPGT